MKLEKTLLGMFTAIALVAGGCGSTPDPDPDPEPDPDPTGFQQPANTVPLNFSVDASARAGEYQNEDLEWKGSFIYDPATRLITYDGNWTGPYAPLYDDGPWTSGGHEPANSVAGDNQFGVTVFLPIPTETVTIKYGLQIPFGDKCDNSGGCWLWRGPDGTAVVNANQQTAVEVEGIALLPEGTVDLRLTLDTNNLGYSHTFAAGSTVKVKGSFNDWNLDQAYDDGTHGDATSGDGVYTYTLSMNDPARKLLPVGVNAEFIFAHSVTAEDTDGTEYKNGTEGGTQGVAAFTKKPDADFVSAPVIVLNGAGQNGNTAVAIE